jgi:hypothetical protein
MSALTTWRAHRHPGRSWRLAVLAALVGTLVVQAAPAQAQSLATATPASLSFGNVEVGTQSGAQSVTISHAGKALLLSSVVASAPFVLTATTCPPTSAPPIPTGGTCTVSFAFGPTAVGAASATVPVVVLVDRRPVTLNVTLSGQGVVSPKPSLTITPPVLDFSNVAVGSTADLGATVTNNGNVALGPAAVPIAISGGQAGDFSIVATTCGPLKPGESCPVTVRFTPGAEGVRTSTLQASYLFRPASDVAVLPPVAVGASARLTGTGTPRPKAGLSLSPPTADFGSRTVGTTSAPAGFTAKNTGNGPGKIATVALSGTAASDFAVTADACTGTTLAPNATCTVSVTFKPGAVGPRPASLGVTMVGGPSATSTLTGAGTAAAKPALALTPPTADFGARAVGTTSAPAGFTAKNTGNGPGKIATVALSGTAAGDFAVTADACTGTTLAPNATCTVSVTFKPGAVGPRTASLGVAMVEGPSASSALTGAGTAVPKPALALEPAGNDFGARLVGTRSATATFTARNTGNAPGKIATVALGGSAPGDYALAGDTCTGATLAPAATCTIGVVFVPTAAGSRPGTLGATMAEGPAASVLLAGTGTEPGLQVDPPVADFGATFVGRPTLAFTITVRSTGTAPATISGFQIDGPEAGDFATAGGDCATATVLAPGATCTILVVATPGAVGPRAARLLVTAGALQDDSQLHVVGLAAPVLRMVPPVGQAGRVTVAVGIDFPPGATVRLGWSGDRTVDVKADAAGRFRLDVLLLHHAELGDRTMKAAPVDVTFPDATAGYLVTAATVRPHGPSSTDTAQRFVARG